MVDDDAEEEHVDVDVEDAGNKTGGEVEVVAVPDAVTHLGRLGPRQVQCGRALLSKSDNTLRQRSSWRES